MASSQFAYVQPLWLRVRRDKRYAKKNVVVTKVLRGGDFFPGITGDADNKLCIAGFRAEANDAAVLVDQALHDAKADACANAYWLGCVKGIEDVGLAFERNAGAVIPPADAKVGVGFVCDVLGPGANADDSMLGYGVDCVVEQIGPDLIESGALGVQRRKVGRQVFLDDDLFFAELVSE